MLRACNKNSNSSVVGDLAIATIAVYERTGIPCFAHFSHLLLLSCVWAARFEASKVHHGFALKCRQK